MSLPRLRSVLTSEVRFGLRSPLFWIALVMMLYLGWSLTQGQVALEGGSGRAAGGPALWFTSEFALAQFLTDLTGVVFVCFLAVGVGMATIRDEEARATEILFATPLRPGEYAWGKFLGVLFAFLLVLVACLGFVVLFNHGIPNPDLAGRMGPFRPEAYLRPALLFLLPPALLVAGVSFFLGAWTRRAIMVFLAPMIFLLGTGALWSWRATTLGPWGRRCLMLLDPTGHRWLQETFFRVDRGVGFYNLEPVSYDGAFLTTRLLFCALGLACVVWAARTLGTRGRVRDPRRRRADEPWAGVQTGSREPAPATPPGDPAPATAAGWSSLGRMVRSEFWELIHSPGLYLFTPIVLFSIMGVAGVTEGPMGLPVLRTPGTVAQGTAGPLTLFLILILLVYGVDALGRDRDTGLAPISHSTSVPTWSILVAKGFALVGLVGVVFLGALLGGITILLVQRSVPITLSPFLQVWAILVVPTCLFWIAFLTALNGLVRNRWTTYAVGIAVVVVAVRLQVTGEATWASSWYIMRGMQWTDLGFLEVSGPAVVWNRLMTLLAAVFLSYLAVLSFPRRETDAHGFFHQIRSKSFLRGILKASPFAIPPVAISLYLGVQVESGFQGDSVREAEEEYWQTNVEEWADVKGPAVVALDVDLDLDPPNRAFRSQGRYRIVNDLDHPMFEIPFTQDLTWDSLTWLPQGTRFAAENRAGLWILRPDAPIRSGDSLWVGFRAHGRVPSGMTAHGGDPAEFILPSSVFLESFTPHPGFIETLGAPEAYRANRPEPPPDLYLQQVDPLGGLRTPFSTRIQITGPDGLVYNSVGRRVEEKRAQGEVTVVWESDYPVWLVNVAAGPWEVWKGQGTEIYYHPNHAFHVEEMGSVLDAAREWYSEWFGPLPWSTVKLSEIRGMSSGALAYPTNITLSELGFLVKADPSIHAVFQVTAHETAHQWWGSLLAPGDGPGGGVISEGLANFSELLLAETTRGPAARADIARNMEGAYLRRRSVDNERALVATDGSRWGDGAVLYNKGAWAPWMLMTLMGREPMLAGLRAFINRFKDGPDYPLLQDLSNTLREHAPDIVAFDELVGQWFYDVVLPEYVIADPSLRRTGEEELAGPWEVTFTVQNIGTGRMPVDLALTAGERFGAGGESDLEYQEVRTTLTLGAGEKQLVSLRADFHPFRIVVDPDVQVLQLRRERAIHEF